MGATPICWSIVDKAFQWQRIVRSAEELELNPPDSNRWDDRNQELDDPWGIDSIEPIDETLLKDEEQLIITFCIEHGCNPSDLRELLFTKH